MGTPEIIGIGAFGIAAFGVIWKMWSDHTRLSNRITDAIEKDAIADTELTQMIKSMKESSDEMGQALREHKEAFAKMQDRFTELLVKTFNDKK